MQVSFALAGAALGLRTGPARAWDARFGRHRCRLRRRSTWGSRTYPARTRARGGLASRWQVRHRCRLCAGSYSTCGPGPGPCACGGLASRWQARHRCARFALARHRQVGGPSTRMGGSLRIWQARHRCRLPWQAQRLRRRVEKHDRTAQLGLGSCPP